VNRKGITTTFLARLMLAMLFGLFVVVPVSSLARAQRRAGQRQPAAKPAQKTTRDYSVFKHEDHRKESNGKELACSACHTITSPAQPERISPATKPASNSRYPYHDSCFRCHREQVYHGDRPAICTVCHTRVSPRATANDLYADFPKPKLGDVMLREFPGYFPHGLHESVLALYQRRHAIARPVFVRAIFTAPAMSEEPTRDICATCHNTDDRGAIALPTGLQAEGAFKQIAPDTFRTIPGFRKADGHAACFNCHWQAQKPTKDDCNGCHLTTSDYQTRAVRIIQPPALSANAVKWFKDWPTGLPKRFSLKFRHNTHTPSEDGKSEINNHDLGCTTCHINIAQMTTLNIPKADVQIISCAPCHSATSAIPVAPGVRVTIFEEMTQKEDGTKKYTCVACHASTIGREQPPCTHYAVLGQPCPLAARTAHR
jgi:hypothetical protein